jgi:predicted transcriptional regulator
MKEELLIAVSHKISHQLKQRVLRQTQMIKFLQISKLSHSKYLVSFSEWMPLKNKILICKHNIIVNLLLTYLQALLKFLTLL